MHVFLLCFRTLPAALIAMYYSGQTGGQIGMRERDTYGIEKNA